MASDHESFKKLNNKEFSIFILALAVELCTR